MIYFEYHFETSGNYNDGIITNIKPDCDWTIITTNGVWCEIIEEGDITIEQYCIVLEDFNKSLLNVADEDEKNWINYNWVIPGYEDENFFNEKIKHFIRSLYRGQKLKRILK